VITENKLEAYVDKVVSLLKDKEKIKELKKGCKVSSKEYTIENMVGNFTKGIVECLSQIKA